MNKKALHLSGMFLLALVSWLLWTPSEVMAETNIPGGEISTDTTWTVAGSPYIVEDSVTVTNNATLIIEPGVVVQINSFDDRLTIDTGGTLSAEGTAAAPILFTGTNQGPSNWDSLVIGPGATATLQHYEVSNGGSGATANDTQVDGNLFIQSSNEVSDGVLFNSWYSSDAFAQNNLAVMAVSPPPDAVAGDEITVNCTVQNGDNAATGSWIDSVYLSQDDAFDADDLLLRRVTHTGGVAANSSYDESLTAALPGVFTGDYYVLVIADSRRTIPDPNFENNRRASDDQFNISIPTLPLDGSNSGALPAGRNRYYRLDVPTDASVLVSAEVTGEWHGELYLRRGAVPTRRDYDLAAASFDEGVQKVLLEQAAGNAARPR